MVQRLAMLWVFLYTAGLTEAQRSDRRSEIRSDMHEQLGFALTQGQGSAAIAGSIVSRTARGMIADVLWRMEEGRDGEPLVRAGSDPPLPWFTMWFISAVIVVGCVASTQAEALGDARVMLAFLAATGAGVLWLGLWMATHRFLGPLCITTGTVCIALGLWWTALLPLVAACLGVSALRRAGRMESLLRQDR